MQSYLDLIEDVLENGLEKDDRTGTGTLSVFGRQLRFDLGRGLPVVTTKRLHLKSVIHELLWFISGNTNIAYLRENNISIWDEWADQSGELGEVYGCQWRGWRTADGGKIDQLAHVVEEIKKNPDSRRLLVNSWNVGALDSMALPPCHYSYQFYVGEGRLSCLLNMRSVDVFLGLPFNLVSYSLLTHMVAQHCGLEVGELIWIGGDVHLYKNHLDQAREQIKRVPYPLPTFRFNRMPSDLFSYRYDDFLIEGYTSHPHIPAPISV